MGVHEKLNRVDAYAKVTGEAKYTDDLCPKDALIAKVVHSTIANGIVKSFDLSDALKVCGVVKIITCFDVPQVYYSTPGHPWSTEISHQDIADRLLLTSRVRLYADDIAVVIAQTERAANLAARLVKVEYEEHSSILTMEDALKEGADLLHEDHPHNILAKSSLKVGEGSFSDCLSKYIDKNKINEYKDGIYDLGDVIYLKKTYKTQRVQHCHLEVPVCYAYQDSNKKLVVVTSTQIPHIVRRVIGQALSLPWGRIRVIKPYIGGGFGNKQEVLYEPLVAFLSLSTGGRAVKLSMSREETFICSRVRHPITFYIQAIASKDGHLLARDLRAFSDQGAYASHGHGIVANAMNMFKQLYHDEYVLEAESTTVYTNTATAGAMRGYGIPQSDFATECMIEDIAQAIGMDPVQFRKLNCMKEDYVDPHTKVAFCSYGLLQCIERGKELMDWENKRKLYENQDGNRRRGIGMAIFCYKTGVYPISLETAAARIVLNQDGSIQVSMGATEIGQGADTVFVQMASEILGISEDRIYIVSTQDTDISPFDTGAYASRQTYVSGMALKKTALLLKDKILSYAEFLLSIDKKQLTIKDNSIIRIETGEKLISMEKLAIESFYNLTRSEHLTAEATSHCKSNTFSSGACFAEIEVDIALGKIKVLNLLNVHDSGTIINPALAAAQVHGGMSMGLGYALSEKLIYDKKGKPLNNNFLDYKVPTAMDTPDLRAEFVEVSDETGPFGNKALGEPPAIPVAPAIRNALLQATHIAFDELPLDPQTLISGFLKAGLLKKVQKEGEKDV